MSSSKDRLNDGGIDMAAPWLGKMATGNGTRGRAQKHADKVARCMT